MTHSSIHEFTILRYSTINISYSTIYFLFTYYLLIIFLLFLNKQATGDSLTGVVSVALTTKTSINSKERAGCQPRLRVITPLFYYANMSSGCHLVFLIPLCAECE